MPQDIIQAHKHSSWHRNEIEKSEYCGCFYCLGIFQPSLITEWLDGPGGEHRGQTALCPKCGIDSVIGSESGYPITEEFLQKMRSHWFER